MSWLSCDLAPLLIVAVSYFIHIQQKSEEKIWTIGSPVRVNEGPSVVSMRLGVKAARPHGWMNGPKVDCTAHSSGEKSIVSDSHLRFVHVRGKWHRGESSTDEPESLSLESLRSVLFATFEVEGVFFLLHLSQVSELLFVRQKEGHSFVGATCCVLVPLVTLRFSSVLSEFVNVTWHIFPWGKISLIANQIELNPQILRWNQQITTWGSKSSPTLANICCHMLAICCRRSRVQYMDWNLTNSAPYRLENEISPCSHKVPTSLSTAWYFISCAGAFEFPSLPNGEFSYFHWNRQLQWHLQRLDMKNTGMHS